MEIDELEHERQLVQCYCVTLMTDTCSTMIGSTSRSDLVLMVLL